MITQLLQIKLQPDYPLLLGQATWYYDIPVNAFGAFLGIAGAWCLYYHQIKKKRNDKLTYASSLLKSIIDTSKKQSENCKDLSDKIKKTPTELHLLPFIASHNLKRLANKVDQEAFYHAFLSKYKRKPSSYNTFNGLYACIDFIDQQIDELKSSNEKEFRSITERKKQYAECFELGLQKAALMLNNPNLQTQSKLLDFVDSTIKTFFQNRTDTGDITYTQNTFVIPIRDELIKNYDNVPECMEIILLLKNATNHYSGIERQSNAFSNDLVEFNKTIMQEANKLEDITKKLMEDFNPKPFR